MNTWTLHHEDGTTSTFEAASARFGRTADFYSRRNFKGDLVRRIFDWKGSVGPDIYLGSPVIDLRGHS
jgi:hypothetical protein